MNAAESPFRIDRLSIRNYKGIDELDIEFPQSPISGLPDVVAIGSRNGVGKSSVLECSALMLVIDEFERHGVEQRDMQTSRFSIHPEYQYTDDGRRRLTGYRVVHALTVTYRNLDTVGPAIDAVSEAGGDELTFRDIAFTHSDAERHLEAARRQAVDKLHRTARQLAEASNRELGRLLEISEEGGAPGFDPYRGPTAGAALLRAEAVDTPISIGSDLITVTMRGVFALR